MSFQLNATKPVLSKVATSGAVAQVGAIIDRQNFSSITAWALAGAITDGTWTILVEESDASNFGSGVTTCTNQTAVSFVSADANTQKYTDVKVNKRYVRVTMSPTGATTGGTFTTHVILTGASPAPVQ